MATLTVGSGKQYGTIAAAVAAARAGDTVAVSSGTYANDFATTHAAITLVSVGGLVTMTSTYATSPAKALLTATADAVIDGFAFTNMHSADGAGSGVLVQGGAVTIRNSLFTGNQNGVNATANAATTVTIQASEFARNGNNDGFSANVQVGAIRSLSIADCYVHDAAGATEVRSRAVATAITTTRIEDNAGIGGYAIDLPAAGAVTLRGNTLEKGTASTVTAFVRYGSESQQAGSSLDVSGNTVVADRSGAVLLLNQSKVTASVASNASWNLAMVATGPAVASANAVIAARPAISTAPLVTSSTVSVTSVPTVPTPPSLPTPPTTPTTGVMIGSPATKAQATTLPASDTAVVTPQISALAQNGRLVLRVSETAWHGDAQFNVLVDGVGVGGTMTATALHAAGQSQTVIIAGAYAPGPHVVAVKFVNDLGNSTGSRALFIDGMSFNGQDTQQSGALTANGSLQLLTAPSTRSTAITVNLSETALHGDALALISIDGKVQGGIQTITASHAAGQTMGMNFLLDLAPGAHAASVTLLNGGAGSGRSLYVDALDVAGQHYASAAAKIGSTGSSTFAFVVAPAPAANGVLFPTIGAPTDLTLLPH